MTCRPVLHAQTKRKKTEEAANAKIMEAEKRNKVSLDVLLKESTINLWPTPPPTVCLESYNLSPPDSQSPPRTSLPPRDCFSGFREISLTPRADLFHVNQCHKGHCILSLSPARLKKTTTTTMAFPFHISSNMPGLFACLSIRLVRDLNLLWNEVEKPYPFVLAAFFR